MSRGAVAKGRIERHPSVVTDDLPAIYEHIAEDNLEAAERVLKAIGSTFDIIASEPECGVLYRTRNPALQSIRMLPVSGYPNYLVFYRAQAEVVRILYVLHGAQHLVRLFRRDVRT
jgi:toxin ParE1/3/4